MDKPGDGRDIFVDENYAYIAMHDEGLVVVNIDNIKNPYVIDIYETPGEAEGLYIDNGFAYIADGDYGLQIIELSY